MLFYSQIKRRFPLSTWKKGQNSFWHERIRNVKLKGDRVSANVYDENGKFKAMIHVLRGGLLKNDCDCPLGVKIQNNPLAEPCEHVAALCIWVVERGSLLRAGLIDGSGPDEEELIPKKTKKEKVKVSADPIAFVRPLFENNALTSITVEPALRFADPKSSASKIEFLNALVLMKSEIGVLETTKIYKTVKGTLLEVSHDQVPILGKLDAPRITHSGNSMLDQLASIYGLENKERIVFHSLLEKGLDREALKLDTLHVGKRNERGRLLTYTFKNSKITVDSETLMERTKKGCVSSRFFWSYDIEKEPKLYRFDTPLSMIARYANRSGTMPENTAKSFRPEGYALLEEDAEHNIHPIAAYRLSLELGVQNFVVDEDWAEFDEWKKNFERKKLPPMPKVDYGFSLRDYQTNGLSWMWSLYYRRLAALLGDDMGLGKTHQVLAFLTSIYCKPKKGVKVLPTLVVAPKSVVAAWIQKLDKYPTGLSWQVFHGSGRVLKFNDVNLVLTTYGILQKESVLREKEWECVILDEAQAIKNAMTISSRAARVLKSRYRIAMTGTPIENQTTDLWSVMEFLLPGYLGSLPRFKRLYGAGREVSNPAQANALKRLIVPFLLRRTKSQVLKELPEKTEEVLGCSMTPIQRKVYEQYLNSKEADKIRNDLRSEGKIDYAGILALLTRLKQVCDHPRLPDIMSGKKKKLDPTESGKWAPFEEIMREALGSDLKVVVFTQYLGVLDLISQWLRDQNIGYVELRGSTADRAAPLKKFADDPECKVFLCSLLAGGLGIDLTSASVCIHYDRWWNPAKENQATDRLHRFGQTRGVQVFKLQCPGTIEDRVAAIIQSKMNLSEALIEESPLGLSVFSRDDLLALLTDVPSQSNEIQLLED
jgi:SNF2 family DNA or RNA helicase